MNLVNYMEQVNKIEAVPDAFFNPLYEKLKMYYITGGMPEPVKMWTQERDVEQMQTVLSNIIGAYERDFAKHPDVKDGARAREYEDALQWLVDARLVSKIYCSTAPGLPISAYDDLSAFKLYMADVGLLRRLSLLSSSAFTEGNRLFVEFKGALTENYVLEALKNQFEATPRYWTMENPRYEVDFLIQRDNDIFPVEVKAESNVESKSLKKFKEKYGEKVKLRIRFSLNNLMLNGDVLNIPLFMADYADKLIGLSLKSSNPLII